jgi:hypothetical protein
MALNAPLAVHKTLDERPFAERRHSEDAVDERRFGRVLDAHRVPVRVSVKYVESSDALPNDPRVYEATQHFVQRGLFFTIPVLQELEEISTFFLRHVVATQVPSEQNQSSVNRIPTHEHAGTQVH